MERHEIRYLLEHRLLPHWFFEQKMQLIGLLLRDQEVLYRIIGDLFEKEGIENPYTADQFAVTVSKPDDKMVVRISFPEPEEEPLCYCSYLFFDETFEKVSYFCIEKGDEENGGLPFVCSWTPEGAHLNHGNCTLEDRGDYLRCIELHLRQAYGAEKSTEC